MNKFIKLLKDDSAATAIEYGLIVALVSVAGIIASTMAGDQVVVSFSSISSTLSSANR